ncbi:MAG: class I SAM-dependent methyltransferase [bacterium]
MKNRDGIPERKWGKTEIAGGRQAFRISMILKGLKKAMPPPARVLDAGCGVGTLYLALLAEGYQSAGVDSSPLCLERLSFKMSRGRQTGTITREAGPFTIAELNALPFPDLSFRAVVSGEVLEHLPDDGGAASELVRVLAPGGVLLVTVPANPKLWSVEDEWAGHKRRYRPDELKSLFESRGLETIDLHHWGWPVIYLYNRLLFQPLLKRKLRRHETEFGGPAAQGADRTLTALMSAAFSVDRLFFRLPVGIGLYAAFRKPS